MIPSRGPNQVTLEDSHVTSDSSNASQVNINYTILRRPKSFASNDNNFINNSNNNTEVTNISQQSPLKVVNKESDNRIRFNGDKRINIQANSSHEQFNGSTSVGSSIKLLNQPISSNIDNNDRIQIKSGNRNATATSSFQVQQPNEFDSLDNTKSAILYKLPQINNNPNLQQAFNNNSGNDLKNNKQLLKTYQERAELYAEARFRILGAAFDNDHEKNELLNLTNSNDINKILNLNSNDNTTNSNSNLTKSIENNSIKTNNALTPTYSSIVASSPINKSQQNTYGQPLIMGISNGKKNKNLKK